MKRQPGPFVLSLSKHISSAIQQPAGSPGCEGKISSMSRKTITSLLASLLVLYLLLMASPSHAQSVEELKKGVVKITAQADGKTKVGTGFIVRLENDAAYIVTASHVIEGDPQPKVVFRGKESKSFPAQVKGKKGGDPRGLAVLVVSGDVPQSVEALPAGSDVEMNGGEEVTVIGFPRTPAVPWAVSPGVVTGQEGEYLVFSGVAAEGNSGGPVLLNGKVIGVVTEVLAQYGYALPAPIMRLALRGWGVSLEGTSKEARQSPEGSKTKQSMPRDITGKDGAPMVLIPAGEFRMGADGPPRELDSGKVGYWQIDVDKVSPAHPVYLASFLIDQYEVTTSHFAKFLHGTKRPAPENWSEEVLEKHGKKPVVDVDWNDAVAYCIWAGKRLPTEAEWEKAARGTDQRHYPWGNTEPSQALANFGWNNAKKEVGIFGLTSVGTLDYYEALTEVGSYEGGKSPYAVYDMAGNVWEWTADWYDRLYYSESPKHNPKGPSFGSDRVIRGGSGADVPGDLWSANRLFINPTRRPFLIGIGFRCAQDVSQ